MQKNEQKKMWILAVIIACMSMALVACGQKKTTSAAVGAWKVESLEANGMTTSYADFIATLGPHGEGMEIVLTLAEDGSYTLDMAVLGDAIGGIQEGTWTEEGSTVTLSSGQGDTTVTIADNKSTMEQLGMKLIFTKSE